MITSTLAQQNCCYRATRSVSCGYVHANLHVWKTLKQGLLCFPAVILKTCFTQFHTCIKKILLKKKTAKNDSPKKLFHSVSLVNKKFCGRKKSCCFFHSVSQIKKNSLSKIHEKSNSPKFSFKKSWKTCSLRFSHEKIMRKKILKDLQGRFFLFIWETKWNTQLFSK